MLIRIKRVMMLLAVAAALLSIQGCVSQKNEFQKKKYKIRKGQPPAQRYYNKYTIFRKKGGTNYRGAKRSTDMQ